MSKEKSRQLGVDFGTASHRLRKLVMLDLARKAGMSKCHRCGQEIESAEDLSIDHTKPWLHDDPQLFWDLGNIAFSHRRCNKVDRPSGARTRVATAAGTSKCSTCGQEKPLTDFRKRASRWNGVSHQCRGCHTP